MPRKKNFVLHWQEIVGSQADWQVTWQTDRETGKQLWDMQAAGILLTEAERYTGWQYLGAIQQHARCQFSEEVNRLAGSWHAAGCYGDWQIAGMLQVAGRLTGSWQAAGSRQADRLLTCCR